MSDHHESGQQRGGQQGADQRSPAEVRDAVVELLRSQYLGPVGEPDELLPNRPDRQYLVGTLYPRGSDSPASDEGDTLGDDVADEALDDPVELANSWRPASAAVSFLHDGEALEAAVDGAHYEPIGTTAAHDDAAVHAEHDGGTAGAHIGAATDRGWRRHALSDEAIRLVPPTDPTHQKHHNVLDGRGRLTAVWREHPVGWLVTVAVENAADHTDPSSPPPTGDCLFQVHLSVRVIAGTVAPYPSSTDLDAGDEEAELRLLYRHKQHRAAGHGCSVTWRPDPDGEIRVVETDMLPATRVPGVSADRADSPTPTMAALADEQRDPEDLRVLLSDFVEAYSRWISTVTAGTTIADRDQPAARRLLDRMGAAESRMREGIVTLMTDDDLLLAFRLANAAMRDQFLQSQHVRENPGRLYADLPLRPEPGQCKEPTWKPFQLAFLLLSLPSTSDPKHGHRDLVDLIWFPTGGGKTEAYLGLAAFEMIRRRLKDGIKGGGTAVLTRYTLRLLTAQQLQRAAALICALQRMRSERAELQRVPEFTIGLLVGGSTTPNSYGDADVVVKELRKAQRPENPFQVQECPWCGTRLFPARRTNDLTAYGVTATRYSFDLNCPHPQCDFHSRLPVAVVDDQIYADPPTMVVATVDKFARLPWIEHGGSVLGQGNVPFSPPSLVIQDELHLLSGPLGSTVAIYEAALQGVLGWSGSRPKIVASTATIRAAGGQVRNLYGREVSLFPPSGLSADDSYFATVDEDSPGRLYIGLMPQAHSPSYATVLTAAALLQAPAALDLQGAARDAYWTVVAYHNSLRELGRTVTHTRDDVSTLLKARERGAGKDRRLRSDGIIELTSNVKPWELIEFLARLEKPQDDSQCVDLVATTNMLSVGIDISRLGLMLMNGQPKTTSEYIQATSRVGRSTTPGLVVTLLRASKPRDRSHYEDFRAYHEAFYRHVEPTSVTPWSLASRRRSLHAALTLLVRHGCGLRTNTDAGRFRRGDPEIERAIGILRQAVNNADPDEATDTSDDLDRLAGEWERRASEAERAGDNLVYSTTTNAPALLREFGQHRDGWETMNSMRSVDRQVRVLALGEVRP